MSSRQASRSLGSVKSLEAPCKRSWLPSERSLLVIAFSFLAGLIILSSLFSALSAINKSSIKILFK